MFSDAVYVAAATGPVAILLDRLIGWWRNRDRDEVEVGVLLDQRWERYTDRLDRRVDELEGRVVDLEAQLNQWRSRAEALAGEVDRYKRMAKSLLRHVIRLRDALAASTSEAPELPADIEELIVTLDLP
jgi:chromosome segregation ATPase